MESGSVDMGRKYPNCLTIPPVGDIGMRPVLECWQRSTVDLLVCAFPKLQSPRERKETCRSLFLNSFFPVNSV